MKHFNLATYGSLMFSEVLTALTGKTFKSFDITFLHYDRFTIEGKSYPGLIHSQNKATKGKAYLDLCSEDWRILDRFEDDLYQRQEVIVNTADGSEIVALSYIVPEKNRALLSETPWDPENFSKLHLQRYIEICKKFRKAYLSCHSEM